ncbi:MAG: PD-(D/E)XK nuclease family protein [Clostridia bacterium]|nr:PD-(D/E)XK nuclease family protein [Clostridia bacterium]
MLTLLYGTYAAQDEVYARIKAVTESGRRAYLLVPDQCALLAERALATHLPARAALLADALGFSRLSNLVCRRYGKLTYRYADAGTRLLFVCRAWKRLQSRLKIFQKLEGDTADALCSLFTEFRACAVTAEELQTAADRLSDADRPLAGKLSELSMLYGEYELLLHEQFAENADDLDILAELLEENDFFGESEVFVDSFMSFTAQEQTILSRILSRGVRVTLTLPFSKDGAHLAEVADTRKVLFALAAKLGCSLTEETCPDVSPAPLAFAKAVLWNFGASPYAGPSTKGMLEVCACDTAGQEIELCAREIHKAVFERGLSYSDIAVVMRSPEAYAGRIDRILPRCGIPVFLSKKTDIAALPLTRLLLSALSLFIYNFRFADMIAYARTGLCGLSDEDCDLFAEYIERWKVSGSTRYLDGEDFTMPWEGYTAEPQQSLEEVNRVKKQITAPLIRLADSLRGAATVRDFASALFDFLCDMQIKERSTDPDFTRYFGLDRTADAVRLWNITLGALDTLTAAAGEERVTTAEFADLCRLLFSKLTLASIPAALDEVIVGDIDTLRTDRKKLVLILGVNDGVFPAAVSESPLLGENDRTHLKETGGLSLSQSKELRAARELFHFVRALDFAAEKVVVSYRLHGADYGESKPSFAVSRLEKLFGNALCSYVYTDLAAAEKLRYPELARRNLGTFDPSVDKAVERVLTARGELPVKTAGGSLSADDLALAPETADEVFGKRMRLSQTKLDLYNGCKMKYYCEKLLGLCDGSDFTFSPAETGTYIHGILETVLRDLHESGRSIRDLGDSEIERIARDACERATRAVLAPIGGSARMTAFFDRLYRNAKLILKNLRSEFADSRFAPFAFEYPIGMENGHAPYAVKLEGGAAAMLGGKIDRVDICKSNGKVYLRIVDYKTGNKSFTESDLRKGKNLQLFLYLMALTKVADRGFFDLVGVKSLDELAPAGAVYFVVKANGKLDNPPPDNFNGEARAEELLTRKGIVLDEGTLGNILGGILTDKLKKEVTKSKAEFDDLLSTVEDAVKTIAEDMRSGRIDCRDTVVGGICTYCKFDKICRKEKYPEQEGESHVESDESPAAGN